MLINVYFYFLSKSIDVPAGSGTLANRLGYLAKPGKGDSLGAMAVRQHLLVSSADRETDDSSLHN